MFSSVLLGVLGILVSCFSCQINKQNTEINKQNIEINKQNAEINKRQLDIVENSKKPRFTIKGDFLPSHTDHSNSGKKVPKYSYTITNEGENISEVSISPESYIFFYMSTGIENEYYIFRCQVNDFQAEGASSIGIIEKDKKFSFCDYVLKDDGASEWEAIAKNVVEHFPDIKYNHKNLVEISYRDYMGEEQEEIFEFNDWDIKAVRNEEDCIPLKIDVDCDLGCDPEVGEMAESIIKEIEDWLEKNESSKGYEIPPGTGVQY